MLSLQEALRRSRPCSCLCHHTLTTELRATGVRALYVLDDALRGFGYRPTYELHGDMLFRQQQKKNDPESRMVAPRFGECLYRRLVGSMLHETLHACVGDVTKANYGILWGLPYGVPDDLPEAEEEAYLTPFNVCEARAWVGVWLVGRNMFGIDWDVRTARDIGTYCFTGGNALNKALPGFRAVAHIDRNHHAERYYARGRKLEEEARAWFDANGLAETTEKIRAAAQKGERSRSEKYGDPEMWARMPPKKIERNELCVCGSNEKYKACCGAAGGGPNAGYAEPGFAR